MGKFTTVLFLGALAIGLSFFTGSRTLDLLGWALPANQEIYKWLGLAAFEGGMYFWSAYFVWGAKGTPQRSISLIMAVGSIIAVAVCTVSDMNIDAAQVGKIGQIDRNSAQAIIDFIGIVIVANVAAFLACHLLSIDNLRRIKEQDAEDQIYSAGLRAISALAPSIAADAAPHLANEWANRTWQRLVPGIQHQTYFIPNESARISAPRKNIDAQKPERGGLNLLNWFKRKEEPVVFLNPAEQRRQRSRPASTPRFVSPVAARRQRNRMRRQSGNLAPVQLIDTQEVAPPPLKKPLPRMKVKKGQGSYVVNRNHAKILPND